MLRRFIKDTAGVAVLEFALVLPILLVLGLQSMQFGWGLFVNHSMLEAVRSTTRSVSVGEITTSDVETTVKDRMNLTVDGLVVTATTTETTVTILASIPKANISIVDIFGLFGTGNLTSSTTMRLE